MLVLRLRRILTQFGHSPVNGNTETWTVMMKIIYWKPKVCSLSLRDLGKLLNGRSSVEMVDGAISSTILSVSFVTILKMPKRVYRLYFVLTVAGTEAVSECILVKWLRDSGRKAAFQKAIK